MSLWPRRKKRRTGEGIGAFAFVTDPLAVLAVILSSLRGAHARQLRRLHALKSQRINGISWGRIFVRAVANIASEQSVLSQCWVPHRSRGRVRALSGNR